MKLTREPTAADNEKAQQIACDMIDAMPSDISPGYAIGATGMVVVSSFTRCIKAEYRLAAFDDFAAHCRRQIINDMEP